MDDVHGDGRDASRWRWGGRSCTEGLGEPGVNEVPDWWHWLGDYLLELVFPTSCAGCGAYGGELVCEACSRAIAPIGGPRCRRCGRPALYYLEVCADCRLRKPAFDATFAFGLYGDPLRAMIHRLKYRNGRRLVPYLAAMMVAAVRGAEGSATEAGGAKGLGKPLTTAYDMVAFVPMHRRRQKQRGYNQAELLARRVASELELPCETLLRRTRQGEAQASLALPERRENVRDAFALRPDALSVRGKHILLVDDVMTSGFTLSECARALKRAGARRVTCCVLARDVPESRN